MQPVRGIEQHGRPQAAKNSPVDCFLVREVNRRALSNGVTTAKTRTGIEQDETLLYKGDKTETTNFIAAILGTPLGRAGEQSEAERARALTEMHGLALSVIAAQCHLSQRERQGAGRGSFPCKTPSVSAGAASSLKEGSL